MSDIKTTLLFRYEDKLYCDGINEFEDSIGSSVKLNLYQFTVIKETSKGVWISDWTKRNHKRFVLLSGLKRYAHPTIEEAKQGFIARKKRQIRILSTQLEYAKQALTIAERGSLL